MVIHGAIDGYSRLVLYLNCADNNRASTVVEQFRKAISNYGLPSRIRTDMGLENTAAAELMLEQRGTERNSVLVGSSVHNQRIERLWRDVFLAVVQLYCRLFYHMEQMGILNPLSSMNLFALHSIFFYQGSIKLCTILYRHGISIQFQGAAAIHRFKCTQRKWLNFVVLINQHLIFFKQLKIFMVPLTRVLFQNQIVPTV